MQSVAISLSGSLTDGRIRCNIIPALFWQEYTKKTRKLVLGELSYGHRDSIPMRLAPERQ